MKINGVKRSATYGEEVKIFLSVEREKVSTVRETLWIWGNGIWDFEEKEGDKIFFFMLYRLHKNLHFTFNIKQIILIVNSVNLFTV